MRVAPQDSMLFWLHDPSLGLNRASARLPLDVAFFIPLKIKWRQILTEWKEANRGSIPKDRFPRLLKKTLDALGEGNISKNLKSGFKGTGIVPLDRNEILKMLPDGAATANSTSSRSQTRSENLNSSNNWTDSIKAFYEESRKKDTEPLTQRKKKKLNVPAGRGIEGIEETILINGDDPQPGTSKTPPFKPNKKLTNASSDTDDLNSLIDFDEGMDLETFSDLESEINQQGEETTYEKLPKKVVSKEDFKPDVYVIVELIFNKDTKKHQTVLWSRS